MIDNFDAATSLGQGALRPHVQKKQRVFCTSVNSFIATGRDVIFWVEYIYEGSYRSSGCQQVLVGNRFPNYFHAQADRGVHWGHWTMELQVGQWPKAYLPRRHSLTLRQMRLIPISLPHSRTVS